MPCARCRLESCLGARCRLESPWRCSHDPVSKGLLELPEILADQVQISVEASRVFRSVLADFRHYWVFHTSSPRSSSGETISGQTYPSDSTMCRIIIRVDGLLICEKFHVARKSTPPRPPMRCGVRLLDAQPVRHGP